MCHLWPPPCEDYGRGAEKVVGGSAYLFWSPSLGRVEEWYIAGYVCTRHGCCSSFLVLQVLIHMLFGRNNARYSHRDKAHDMLGPWKCALNVLRANYENREMTRMRMPVSNPSSVPCQISSCTGLAAKFDSAVPPQQGGRRQGVCSQARG
jgi:hypothetical protein